MNFQDYDNTALFSHMLTELRAIDVSYGNDAMPSMLVESGAWNNRELDLLAEVKIFVDYADHDKRDYQGGDTIAVYAYFDGDYVATLWEGEATGLYIDEIRRAIAHYQG